ncbi:response regulator [Spirosoma aerolatum]|uniref:response regulator n=1 Tax=Spirosoma aerolatum TaxID=1211326 RepID=UPI0009AEAEBF|nr:response regulator [Spirosoma aerolatum]
MFASFPILLVDDDPAIADILKRVAERVFPEATIAHARDFTEAAAYLANVDKDVFRLVLLDIDLKTDSTGFDFLSLLRDQSFGQLVPVIVLSSSLEESKARESYLRGANAFTNKPFTYAAWKTYVEQLRSYWYETVTIPQIRFRQGPDAFSPSNF